MSTAMGMGNAANMHNLQSLQAAVSRYAPLGNAASAQMAQMGSMASAMPAGAPAMDVAGVQADMMTNPLAAQSTHPLQSAAALETTVGSPPS